MNNLANVLKERGEYREAELLLERAVSIRWGQVDIERRSYYWSGLWGSGEDRWIYREAELLLERAVSIRWGQVDIQRGGATTGAGCEYQVRTGGYREAELLLERAVSIRWGQVDIERRSYYWSGLWGSGEDRGIYSGTSLNRTPWDRSKLLGLAYISVYPILFLKKI